MLIRLTITILFLLTGIIIYLIIAKIKEKGIGKNTITDSLVGGIIAGPIGIIVTLLTIYIQISLNDSKEIKNSAGILYTEMIRIYAESKSFDSTAQVLLQKYRKEDNSFSFPVNDVELVPVLMVKPFVLLSNDKWQSYLDKVQDKFTPEEYATIQEFFNRYQWFDKNNPITVSTILAEDDRPKDEADRFALKNWWQIYASQYLEYKVNTKNLCEDIRLSNKLLELSELKRNFNSVRGCENLDTYEK
jgi:hypothetical protein